MCVSWCKRVHTGLVLPRLWPTPVSPPADGWHQASTQTCFSPLAFSGFRCAAQPQLSQSHRGILLPVGSGPQDTELSFHGGVTNTPGPERTSLWQGEPWKLGPNTRPSFWVSLSPESRPSPADARRAAKTEVLAFRGQCTFSGGALWLIGGKQSGYSRQTHQMNANKAVRMLRSAYLRKKRSEKVWQEGEVDGMEQTHRR